MGKGAALAWLVTALIVILAVFYYRLLNRRVEL
jgi:ABC-type sugar transport system permease subunit